jgi:hypothetical protein
MTKSWIGWIGAAVVVMGLASGLASSPASAQSANALVGWMCKTTNPVGWCPTSLTNPLPVTPVAGGTPFDVNVVEVGGNTVTTSVPVSGLGTSGTPAGGVLTIQGQSSMEPVVVSCETGATDMCKVEDAAVASGDTGVASLGVVTDGSTPLAASGDYSVQGTDLAGNNRVVGSVASGTTDSGNPVKVGGVYRTVLSTLTNGQRGDVAVTDGGAVISAMGLRQITGADGLSNTSSIGYPISMLGASSPATALAGLSIAPLVFNGSTWDRQFTCPSSAVINVAAGTTELVALTASQVIRVCSFTITGVTALTTATFVYGTGAACGTSQVALTGAMQLGVSTSISNTGSGGSLFRTASANALCLTAVTGTVTGFLSYAKY